MSADEYEKIWHETNIRFLKLNRRGVYGDRRWNAIFEQIVDEHHKAKMEALRRCVG